MIAVVIVGAFVALVGIGIILVAKKFPGKQRCVVCLLEFQHGDRILYDPQEKAAAHYFCVMSKGDQS